MNDLHYVVFNISYTNQQNMYLAVSCIALQVHLYYLCILLQLVMEAGFSYLKEELEEFLEHIQNLLRSDALQLTQESRHLPNQSVVVNILSEIIEWAKETKKQGLFKVAIFIFKCN